jgi:prevent-host-death family protein
MSFPHQAIPAGEFKAKCLQLMDDVNTLHCSIVITKHGKPVARLVPYQDEAPPLFGYLKNTVEIYGDLLSSVDESWDADD